MTNASFVREVELLLLVKKTDKVMVRILNITTEIEVEANSNYLSLVVFCERANIGEQSIKFPTEIKINKKKYKVINTSL